MRELTVLDQVRVASPCSASWDEMQGDSRKRFCVECRKPVYNFAGMTRAEIEALLAVEGKHCARIYRRPDGTMLTADCPTGKSRLRRVFLMRLGLAAGFLISIPAVAGALRQLHLQEWELWNEEPFLELAYQLGLRERPRRNPFALTGELKSVASLKKGSSPAGRPQR